MVFREWLQNEVKTNGFQKIARTDDGRLTTNHAVYVDGQGNLVQGYPGTGKPYIEVQPAFSQLNLQNMHPQGKLFTDIIGGLRKIYGNQILNWNVHVYNASHPETGNKNRERTAGYWLNQPQGHFATSNLPPFLYHGTSTNLWNDNIHQTGLLPRMLNKSAAGGSYGSQGDAISHHDKIYLSLHPDTAARSASRQAAQQYGGNPLIIKIDTKGLMPDKFGNDEDSRGVDSVKHMGTVAYSGRIPASIIQPVIMGIKSNPESFRFDKWVPYKPTEMTEHPLTTKLKENPSHFSHYDSPYYYALLDAGYIEVTEGKDGNGFSTGKKTQVIKPITDQAIRQLIKASPWAPTVDAIMKDTNNYGMSGIKSLDRMPMRVFVTPEQKQIKEMLLSSGMFRDSDGDLSLAYFKEKPSIALAKALQARKMDYRAFIKQIGEIASNYNS